MTGDTLMTRPLAVFDEPEYLRLRDLLRNCDCAFTNLESPVHPYLDDPHWQRPGVGGTYMTIEPPLLGDLKWLGINLVACGSSHAEDYGLSGVLDTMRYLDDAGIAHAGSGRHLAESRAPAYVDTAAGRIGLVAATLHYSSGARAGAQRRDTLGNPGVNGIRNRRHFDVPDEVLDRVKDLARDLGLELDRQRRSHQGSLTTQSNYVPDAFECFGQSFLGGSDSVVARSKASEVDIVETMRSVELAKSMCDVVVFSLHGHEQGGSKLLSATRRTEIDEPGELAREISQRAIDAGADIVAGHGPQIPLGVEIYKERPIFHGLGAFIFQLETIKYLPEEAYERYDLPPTATPIDFLRARYADDTRGHTADPEQWEQFAAVCEFSVSGVESILLYPLDLGHDQPRWLRGRPVIADAEQGRALLKRLAERCGRFGVELEIENDCGRLTWR